MPGASDVNEWALNMGGLSFFDDNEGLWALCNLIKQLNRGESG